MRFSSGIVVLACAVFGVIAADCAKAAAAEQFPYTAYVSSDDVYIRSGPGKNYYPTEKLPRGEAVEVYRHDPGGWYAIRPPKTSFSWVPADALKPQGDHIAVVEKDHAMCYVGTRFSNAHDVHQVRLDRGEQVEILDVKQIGDGTDAQSWCQIAPPSGEFRWVFGKFVDRDPPSNLSRPSDPDRPNRRRDVFQQNDRTGNSADADDRTAQRGDWMTKGAASQTVGSDTSSAALSRGAQWRPAGGKTPDDKSAATVDPFQTELSNIDLEVSKIVSDDPATWEFTALRRRTEAMLPRADTALERGRVRLVLNRIARFEDVKRRNDLINQPNPANIAIASTRTSVLPVDEPVRYDGVGKLTPVVSQRPNAPQYALVDQSNQVVSFISPAPGVNLQPYVGQEVGVSGQRGYMPELRKPHVMAMRVNVLEAGSQGTILR